MASTPAPRQQPWPGVSVVVPVLNEERHLEASVHRILAQDYSGEMEVVLAVAPSRDRTEQIAQELAGRDPRVLVVANPAGRTPTGLNAAVAASHHDVVVRVDGHGMLPQGYVRRVVEVLEETGAANVGGMMVPQGRSPFEQAVAWAMGSRWGMGGARFHVGGEAGPADSVYLGAFRREVLAELGGFDERYARAQDWELNHRIRAAGHVVWFTPDLRVTYRPRGTWSDLVTQFFTTGGWRREVMRQYPDSVSLRYLAPPAVAAGVGAGLVLGGVGLLGGPAWLRLALLLPGGYGAGVVAVSARGARELAPRARAWVPLVLATMHLCWGAGFLRGPATTVRRNPAAR